MPSPKRERKILIDLDAQPMPLPDIVISDRPELVVDLGNLRQPSNIKVKMDKKRPLEPVKD